MLGAHCVQHWGKQQDRVALSSGEAELKSSCKGLVELLGMNQIQLFLTGHSSALEHRIDASAAERMLLRQGAGTQKHLEVRQLWTQQAVIDYNIKVLHIPRIENFADLLCSIPKQEIFDSMLQKMGFTFTAPCSGQGGENDEDEEAEAIDVLWVTRSRADRRIRQ